MKVRLDRSDEFGELRLDRGFGFLREPKRTEEGYLVTEAIVAKPGILHYRLPDGSVRRELVLPAELKLDASVSTIAHKPVTLEHPPERMLTPKTVQKRSQGTVTGEARIDDEGRLVVPLVIQGDKALAALKRGVREISPGYRCRIDSQPGTHPRYGGYDCIQRSRRYNHVAITERGRGGRDVAIRTDAAVELDPFTAGATGTSKREVTMNPLIALLMGLGVSEEVAKDRFEDVQSTVGSQLRQDAADAVAAKTTAESAKTEAESKLADAVQRADTAEKLETRLDWHKERSSLEALAGKHNVSDTDAMDNAALKRSILAKGKVNVEGKSDEWVDARLDAMIDAAPVQRADSDRGAAFRAISHKTHKPVEREDSAPVKRPPTTHRSVRNYGPQAK